MRRTLLGVIFMMLGGCAPGNPGLVIGNVIDIDDQCTFSSNSPARLSGVFDVGVPGNSYEAALRFGNQLVNLSQSGTAGIPIMADPNVIQVQTVEVELRDIGGNPLALPGLPNPFAIPAGSVAVPSGDGETAGESLGLVQIIPSAYAAELASVAGTDAQIVVAIVAVGTTLGGAEVVSYEFIYPIQLCSGCLTACLMDEEGMNICRPSCSPGQDTLHLACDLTCSAG